MKFSDGVLAFETGALADGSSLNGYHREQYGGSVGGPIKRNSTFFFINTQWLTAKQTQNVTRTVLTATARQGLWRYVIGGRNTPPPPSAHPLVSVNPDNSAPLARYTQRADPPPLTTVSSGPLTLRSRSPVKIGTPAASRSVAPSRISSASPNAAPW